MVNVLNELFVSEASAKNQLIQWKPDIRSIINCLGGKEVPNWFTYTGSRLQRAIEFIKCAHYNWYLLYQNLLNIDVNENCSF